MVACSQCLRNSQSSQLHRQFNVIKPADSLRNRHAAYLFPRSARHKINPAGERAQIVLLGSLMRTSDIKGEEIISGLPDSKSLRMSRYLKSGHIFVGHILIDSLIPNFSC